MDFYPFSPYLLCCAEECIRPATHGHQLMCCCERHASPAMRQMRPSSPEPPRIEVRIRSPPSVGPPPGWEGTATRSAKPTIHRPASRYQRRRS